VVQAGSIQHLSLTATTPAWTDRPAVPRQLPGVVRDFTGRVEHLAALDALLPDDHDEQPADVPGAVVITALDGTAGIGKTTLAVCWAHRVQHQFPDGTLHVNLRGYGPGDPATPAEVLDGFLRALGTPPDAMPAGVDAQAALFRSLLAGRRMLLVLDNAHSADQVRPLLPGTPGCVVVVTSRDSLTGLVVTEGAHRLTLDLLTETEALNMVRNILGPAPVSGEPAAVAELIRLCARLPLALRIAASRVAAGAQVTVAEVVAELADAPTRLEVLSRGADERSAVRAVFDWSYRRLTEGQARLFRRLGLHPGPDLSVDATAAITGLDQSQTRRGLEELAAAHLITPSGRNRYRFHDLLRAYAAHQAHQYDSAADRHHALDGLLGWYAHTATTCDRLLYPAFARVARRPAIPAHPTPIADPGAAWSWLNIERGNVLAALRHAAAHGQHQHTLILAADTRFLGSLGGWEDVLEAVDLGLVAARQCGEHRAEAWFHDWRGGTLITLRRWDQARAEYQRAGTLAREIDDQYPYAWSLNGLARVCMGQGQFAEAMTLLRDALPLARGIDTGRCEAVVEGNLSIARAGVGDYQQALVHGRRGLALRRQCGDRSGEARAVYDLARAWQGLGDYLDHTGFVGGREFCEG
jgi:tetratricopeptide (TPR) repeat protein